HYRCELLAGVKVWRCPLWVPRRQSGVKRILHLASFALTSFGVTLWQGLFWRPDVVFVVEPPLFCAPSAWIAARLSGARAWLHVQDFEVDVAFDLGLLSSGWMRHLAVELESWLMHRFDFVSTISGRMLERLAAKGVRDSQRVLFTNWVDTDAIYPMKQPSCLRDELGIRPETIVALYSGNMGEKQGLEVLVAAARLLAEHPQILFVLCGEGGAKKRLLELAKDLPNVHFLQLQPLERLNALLNLANVHLLPQRPDAADLVMPSKLQGMFASGRPVVATAHPGTQVAQTVDGCGVVVPPGEVTALADAVLYLAEQPEERSRLGQAARMFALTHWKREKILEHIEQVFVFSAKQSVIQCH
ncbi:MAG TPA: WcaI family glycosyltransferase, partial [Candidatus Caenarcaniphilales bacterium]